jgi:DNA-binding MarR family transcriptional regulator
MQQQSIGRLISILHRASLSFFQRESRPMGLSQGQFRILHFIKENPGISQNKIQEHFDLDRGNVSVLIKGLQTAGFVRRQTDMNDKRAMCINPTKKTLENDAEIQHILDQWTKQLLTGFTPGERILIFELLERMIKNVKE